MNDHILTLKELSNLSNVSINLSKIEIFLIETGKIGDVSAGIDENELSHLEEKMNVSQYLRMAKDFLYIPKIKEMYDSINRIYKTKD